MPWRREGECPPERCKGQCCDHLAVWFDNTAETKPFLHALAMRGLQIGGDALKALVSIPQRCQYLTDEGRCSIYSKRPDFCRTWPEEPAQLLSNPNCGYTFVWVEEDF